MVDPAAILAERVEVVEGDEIRLEILLPEADALHLVIRVRVDVDGSAEMVHRQAVVLIDPHLLLVGVADAQIGNVLLAVDVGTRTQSDTAEDPRLERMLALLREVELPRHRASNRHRMPRQIQVVLPLLLVRELNPRADRAEVVFDDGEAAAEADDVVMLGDEVEADVILLTTVDGQASHHDPRVALFTTNVDGATVTRLVRVVSLDDVRLVDEHVGIDVRCIDPLAAEVLRQSTAGLDDFRFDGRHSHSLRRLLDGLQGVALGGDAHTEVKIVVTILQEAAELLVLTRLLRVGDGEVMILADEPIAEATVLDDTVEGAVHARALLVRDVELLVGD